MYKYIYNWVANIYYDILVLRNYLMTLVASKIDYKDIPIVINNRNRLTFLSQLVDSLQNRGYRNIYILDNNSTYEPLLKYYSETGCKVVYLGQNLGFDALDKIKLYKEIRKNYFVYTDPDVVPVDDCPEDFLYHFMKILRKYPKIQKVGFSLKIDDLPDCFDKKESVIGWEKQFFEKEIEKDCFLASIDTTFALHRPYATLSTKGRFKSVRTGYPYTAKHMPWYNDSSNLTEEELFYIKNVEIGTHWSAANPVYGRSFFVRIKDKIWK